MLNWDWGYVRLANMMMLLLYLLVYISQNHPIFNSRISITLPTFLAYIRFSQPYSLSSYKSVPHCCFRNLYPPVSFLPNFRFTLLSLYAAMRRDRDTTKKTGFTYGSGNGVVTGIPRGALLLFCN